MPIPLHSYWTADLVRELPDDGNRYELVRGELLVTPAPRRLHQDVLRELVVILAGYLRTEPVGQLYFSPADISWGPDTLLQPDLFVVPAAEAGGEQWSDIRHLLLVVEILSPGTARQDRFQKRRRYQEAGVPTYWIVDPEERTVEIWTPDDLFPAIEHQRLRWRPEGAGRECVVELGEVFGV